MVDKIKLWAALHPYRALVFITLAALAPFLAKPFNMDDPLFVWSACQIHAHPADPYGFALNWYGFTQPMYDVTENPPLNCYYLALAGLFWGWSEVSLHCAELLPAILAVLGTYRLAKNFCQWPFFAALATLFAPGFWISSATVMCDVPMLAFWVWAVVFWVEGLKQNISWKLFAAGVLAALALLTKYYGICLLPLLLVYGWLKRRRPGRWMTPLLIPLAVLGSYEWLTKRAYGHPLFFTAANYASHTHGFHGLSMMVPTVIGLSFAGGCFAGALFLSPLLWRARVLIWFGIGAVLAGLAAHAGGMMTRYAWLTGGAGRNVEIQVVVWAAVGIGVLALAAVNLWKKHDAGSWLLALWVAGTFLFATAINWTINGRSMLPMIPALAILMTLRLEQWAPKPIKYAAGLLAIGAVFSFLTVQSEFLSATGMRQNVERVMKQYAASSETIWFKAHWGFQYYIQLAGATAFDSSVPRLKAGDLLVIPEKSTNAAVPDGARKTLLDVFEAPVASWVSVYNPGVGASFYASVGGPLALALGPAPPETVFVYRVTSVFSSHH